MEVAREAPLGEDSAPLSQIKAGKVFRESHAHRSSNQTQKSRKQEIATPKPTVLPHKPESRQQVSLKPEPGRAEQS